MVNSLFSSVFTTLNNLYRRLCLTSTTNYTYHRAPSQQLTYGVDFIEGSNGIKTYAYTSAYMQHGFPDKILRIIWCPFIKRWYWTFCFALIIIINLFLNHFILLSVNIMDYKRILTNWTLTYFITTFLVVYVLNIPFLVSGQKELVNEYYYKNMMGSLIFDYFLIAFYLFMAYLVWSRLKIEDTSKQMGVVILTTIMISGSFMIYFRNKTPDTSFFYRWFEAAGVRAVIYDIILLLATYYIFKIIS